MEAIKALFGSKKFWLTLIGSAVVGGLTYAGVDHQMILIIAGLFGVNTYAQGQADSGKK